MTKRMKLKDPHIVKTGPIKDMLTMVVNGNQSKSPSDWSFLGEIK